MKITYEDWNPGPDALATLDQADVICRNYAAQGYDLTLRQLYYQFVSRALIPNDQRAYKRLGDVLNKGRLAGYIDWDHIVDRTRNLVQLSSWDGAAAGLHALASQFRTDIWRGQDFVVEVWVEKEALAGVVQRAANRWQAAWFSCRGYVSQSELWGAAQRIGDRWTKEGQATIVLHLGDHDPSGIDMSRDITDRLVKFIEEDTQAEASDVVEVRRIALNYDQVQTYNPPPNPAKLTDSRSDVYVRRFGSESWELDALDPATLDALIEDHINGIVDHTLMDERRDADITTRRRLRAVADGWTDDDGGGTDAQDDGRDDPAD